MRFSHFFILAVTAIFVSCKHELAELPVSSGSMSCELLPNETLSDIIPGIWLHDARKGYPYFDTLWHEIDGGTTEFNSSGHFIWGDLQGGWTTDDAAQTIEFDFDQANYSNTTLYLSEFDRCIFVTEHLTDEGFTYNRFRKQ